MKVKCLIICNAWINLLYVVKVKVLVAQSCQTLATPWTIAHQLLCAWDSLGKNTGVGCHALLQGIFLTQGSNLHLMSLALANGFFITTTATREAHISSRYVHMWKLKIFTKMYIATWGGHGNPLQYPCLKCPHGKRTLAGCSLCCAKNRTQLSNSAQHNTYSNWGLPRGLTGKQSTFQRGTQETWVQFPCWEDPKEEEMQPTPVFSPGKSHGLRSLAGYSP